MVIEKKVTHLIKNRKTILFIGLTFLFFSCKIRTFKKLKQDENTYTLSKEYRVFNFRKGKRLLSVYKYKDDDESIDRKIVNTEFRRCDNCWEKEEKSIQSINSINLRIEKKSIRKRDFANENDDYSVITYISEETSFYSNLDLDSIISYKYIIDSIDFRDTVRY